MTNSRGNSNVFFTPGHSSSGILSNTPVHIVVTSVQSSYTDKGKQVLIEFPDPMCTQSSHNNGCYNGGSVNGYNAAHFSNIGGHGGASASVATNAHNCCQIHSITASMSSLGIKGNPKFSWIICSGATDHVTCCFTCFSYVKYVTGVHVNLPDQYLVPATHIGSSKLYDDIILRDIL